MTQAPQSPPPGVAAWFYQTAGRQFGPTDQAELADALSKGLLAPETLVWREGFPNWLPAIAAAEFYYAADRARRLIRNARINCILLFVVFVLAVPWFLAVPVGMANWSRVAPAGGGACMGLVAAAAALFAVVYVPLRWRIIMSLPRAYKLLGLIGGFGLIAILSLAAIGLGAWFLASGAKLPGMP